MDNHGMETYAELLREVCCSSPVTSVTVGVASLGVDGVVVEPLSTALLPVK